MHYLISIEYYDMFQDQILISLSGVLTQFKLFVAACMCDAVYLGSAGAQIALSLCLMFNGMLCRRCSLFSEGEVWH